MRFLLIFEAEIKRRCLLDRFLVDFGSQNGSKIDQKSSREAPPKRKVDKDAAEEAPPWIRRRFLEPKSPKVLRIRSRNGAKIRKKANQKSMEKSMPILIDLGCDF
jgi:hypothetical protein